MILLPDSENKRIYETIVKPKDIEVFSQIERPNDISFYDYIFSSSVSEERRGFPYEEEVKVEKTFPSKIEDCYRSKLIIHEEPVFIPPLYHARTVDTYVNPLHLSYNEIMKFYSSSKKPLLSLFNKFHNFDRNRELEVLEQASDMIKRLQDSSFDDNTIKEIIQKLWPKFGYFATHIYDNLDLVVNEECKYYELQSLIDAERHLRYIEENGLILDEAQRNEFLNMVGIKNEAEDNVKVLSLVKKVNDRIGSNR